MDTKSSLPDNHADPPTNPKIPDCVSQWKLNVTSAEKTAIGSMLDSCS
ncbi:hypothetical protein [Streptomyces monashensis]|nr:hypothetical protein [Streptomyces monashensis]